MQVGVGLWLRIEGTEVLLQRVWGPERTGEPGLVREVVKRLRRKLGDDAATPPTSSPSLASATAWRRGIHRGRRRVSQNLDGGKVSVVMGNPAESSMVGLVFIREERR